jgi:hypothetical protein
VVKEEEKKERSKGKKVVVREYLGRQSNKEDESCTGQQVEEDTNRCFGAPHGEEGITGWRNPQNVGYVDLRILHLDFSLGFLRVIEG